MNRCVTSCNASPKFQQYSMNEDKCIWYMPRLKSYGTIATHGVYNFNCGRFWNDGGDCESKGSAAVNGWKTRYNALKRASTSYGLSVKSVIATAVQGNAGVPVVAMAAIAVVAGVAMFAKKAMA